MTQRRESSDVIALRKTQKRLAGGILLSELSSARSIQMMEARNPSIFAAMKILECGEGVAAAFGTKLLADLGGEVIKVEPPSGDLTRQRGPFPQDEPDREKSGLFIYLN